jgi:hypothetical protein
MRRHVAELCVQYAIIPMLGEPCRPRARPGSRAVALQYIGGPSGYWACLHDIGLAIADAAWGAFECELAAWAWAGEMALTIPTFEVLDLAATTLLLELALDVDVVAREQRLSQPTQRGS